MGSGTTALVCMNLDRKFIGIEDLEAGNECFSQDDTGDDKVTIEDLKTLFSEGLLWNYEQTD